MFVLMTILELFDFVRKWNLFEKAHRFDEDELIRCLLIFLTIDIVIFFFNESKVDYFSYIC